MKMIEDIQLVVSDLDGTLINSNWELSDFAKKVITELIEKKIEFIPCSARIFKAIPEWMRNNKRIRYVVCENGAKIFNNLTQECILTNAISYDDTIQILEELEKTNPYWTCSINGHLYSHQQILDDAEKLNIRGGYLEEIIKTRTFVKNIDEIKSMHMSEVNKIHFVTDTIEEHEKLKTATQNIRGVRVGSSYIKNVELSHPMASKGYALAYLQDLLSITMKQTMALGDNENDLSMLERSEHSVAVGNATEQVKKMTRYIARPNSEEGAAVFINEMLLDNVVKEEK